MDFTPKKSIPNPLKWANPISKILFIWMIPLFRTGSKRDLVVDDMFNVMDDHSSNTLGDQLSVQWEKQLQKCKEKGGRVKPRLFYALLGVFGKKYALVWTLLMFNEWGLRVAQPLILRLLIRSFSESSSSTKSDQFLYAGGVCLLTLLQTLVLHPTLYIIYNISMQCRIACSSVVYRKSLRLSKSSQGQTTVGQLVNLLSNDVNRFDQNLVFIPYLLIGTVQLAIFIYFLWEEFGPSCLGGVLVIVILMPVQYWNGKLSTFYRRRIATRTDERGRIMNEIIIAMRVIKMYAWEKPFSALIHQIRVLEVEVLRKRSYLRGVYLSLYSSASKLVPFLTALAYVLSGHTLTAEKVFFAVAIYNTVIQSVIYLIPSAASGIGEIFVSLQRLEEFLQLDEQLINENMKIQTANIIPSLQTDEPSMKKVTPHVYLDSVCASWTSESDNKTLNSVNLKVEGDQLVIVVGPVGSGKTSLLHALIAELPVLRGKLDILGRTSYASQEPWIFAGDLRQNVLFGNEFDEQHYYNVIKASALEEDLVQLAHGDKTIVGERGMSLSGGQKARVNLARALYQKADIYLLDDPLSAVDTRVSRHLFEKCIKKYLQGNLRILVTHQLQYLPQADHILVFNNGEVMAQGTYNELIEKGIDFVSLMASESEDAATRKESVVKMGDAKPPIEEHDKQEAEAEKMVSGSIGGRVYLDYFRAGESTIGFVGLISIFIVSQIFISAADYWLSMWTDAEEVLADPNKDGDYLGEEVYIWVYAGIVIGVVTINLGRAIGFFAYCMRISINIHNAMFSSVVRAPTKFFDDNPSGRVMNRFTKDLGSMDELLPPTFFDTLIIFLQMFGVVIVVVIANYYIIPPAIVIIIALYFIRRFYAKTARDIKRIEAITKSPVFTHMTASFQGLTTIRSSNSQEKLIQQFDDQQDIHSSAWFLFFSAARSFAVWIEMVSVIFLIFVTFSFLIIDSSTLGGKVGLAVSSALTLTGWFQYGMRQSTETENLMTSVERTLEYTKIESEAPLESNTEKAPPKDWPSGGEILFQNVYLAYEDKDVLKNLTFNIKSNEKIGIVGRTGAGKSSIIQALFRMTEPRGDIFIDGIRINDIGLHDLRRNISIIPQDPVLFSGTMRYNLDPFDQFPDDELWKVLEEVELKNAVPALEFKVADGGSNFSVGQRQLVCLARAILRKNKIIVMDEATANVDPRTDNFIQKTIRTKFWECSIVTIAHRLHSVIDCDRILVLDNGYLKEYDHPHILLQNRDGILTSMVGHTGRSTSALLKKIAAECYTGRRASFQASIVEEISGAEDNQDE